MKHFSQRSHFLIKLLSVGQWGKLKEKKTNYNNTNKNNKLTSQNSQLSGLQLEWQNFACKSSLSNSKCDWTFIHIFHMTDCIPHLKEYLRQEVWLVCDEGKESGYDGKNTGQNERISCLIVYNHLQQLHTLIYGNFL